MKALAIAVAVFCGQISFWLAGHMAMLIFSACVLVGAVAAMLWPRRPAARISVLGNQIPAAQLQGWRRAQRGGN